jgi:hypothetical protein
MIYAIQMKPGSVEIRLLLCKTDGWSERAILHSICKSNERIY